MTSTVRAPLDASAIYEDHRAYFLGVLGRRCAWMDPSDREALLHDAFAVLLEKQSNGQLDTTAMSAPQLRAYLTQTALNKAMDEGKRAGRRRSVSLDDQDLGIDPPDPARDVPDRLAASFDDARIREIVSELPDRQQVIIKLRFFLDRTPDEIQRHMGVTERVYRRELERATRQIAERAELVRNGRFCESRRSLILAYVTGVAGPSRMADARRHLASCPGCSSWARELRLTIDRAAALVPAPIGGGLTLAVTAQHHHVLHLVVSAPRRLLLRGGGLTSRARTHAIDLGSRIDASKAPALAGARPSAAAVAIASCLAAGSGATYCVVQGMPAPIRSLIGDAPAHVSRPLHAQHRAKPTQTVAATTATVSTTATTSTAATRPTTARTTSTRSQPRTSRRAAQAAQVHKSTAPEFGVGNGAPASSTGLAAGSTSSSASGHPAASAPPPTPSKPSAEFDP